jgi:hypothetical protein
MRKINKTLAASAILILTGFLILPSFAGIFRLAVISQANTDSAITVPLGGNTWKTGTDTSGGNVSNEGIVNWTNQHVKFVTYVRFGKKGTLKLSLNLKVPDSKSQITISALKKNYTIYVTGNEFNDHYAGDWNITDTGYVAFEITGTDKSGSQFAQISSIKLSGTAAGANMAFVKNNEGNFFYWGRRGPSVHLNYPVPETMNAEWFYNEVTVPVGNDVIGSYFMADGFAEGYFGMQVNSPTERHILFSVWSPFKTDNPDQVPSDQKINLLKKGAGVHAGEFGSEGSGGQSYLLYNWKAGNTYKFLMHARPEGTNHTVYTAYFFAPEQGKWQLIASFSRPQTTTYLTHLHSFLENFEPEQGIVTRLVYFRNEWVVDETGKWVELNEARFTVDNTGAKGYRMDYAGGMLNNAFFLVNCGFFNYYTLRNTIFEKPLTGKKPDIDLNTMP